MTTLVILSDTCYVLELSYFQAMYIVTISTSLALLLTVCFSPQNELWPAFGSVHLLESHVAFATLVRVVDNDNYLTVKRDTSTQEGSGSFFDVINDSTRSLISALLNRHHFSHNNPFGAWELHT